MGSKDPEWWRSEGTEPEDPDEVQIWGQSRELDGSQYRVRPGSMMNPRLRQGLESMTV